MAQTRMGLAAAIALAVMSGVVSAQLVPADRPAGSELAEITAAQVVPGPAPEACADARAWLRAEETTEGILYRLAREQLELCMAVEARAAAMRTEPRR